MSDSIALAPDALKAFLVAFNLDRFGVGRHIIRDQHGGRAGDMRVESLWLATIQPSFHPAAYFMVMHADAHPRALFCFRGVDSLPKIQDEPAECPGLEDRVSASLKHVDLCPRESNLVLDGIRYVLQIRTAAVSADVTFASPKTESLRNVERALFEMAEVVVRITARQDMTDYLKVWRPYVT